MLIPLDVGFSGGFGQTHSIYHDKAFVLCYEWGKIDGHVDSLGLVIRGGKLLKCGLHAPDLTSILGNGAIAGELATSGNVVDHLLGPFLRVLM